MRWLFPCAIAGAILWALMAWVVFGDTLTIRNDRGGPLVERVKAIERHRKAGTRIIIAGQCYSACTMYLGLPNTCVLRSSRLGFHGPQSQYYGISLPPEMFDHWSRIMAGHYPPQIRTWFMQSGRETTLGIIVLTGDQAVSMGARACP